ncbi:MAG: 3-hydroxyacyl-CoA dehydrogenase NAD-binding domain-containing protein, partial [Verrucomicrobiota bacterium]|nr:3-hydroxyacyl-CoA dehydrogenase NAD-binding domain-containing protein [Verrucomicrobiota bacterium]
KTRGHYPAQLKALEIVAAAPGSPESESLARERDAIVALAGTDAFKNLLRLFMQQERAKKLKYGSPGNVLPIARTAMIGAGVMGSGIAQWIAARGLRVVLRDIDVARVASGMANIARLYSAGVKRHIFTPLEARDGADRIFPTATEVSLTREDLVIEAAVEKIELKKKIFARLDELAGSDTILATNTSALSIAEIASATKNPGRVIGIHFFNPVHQMQLVEIGVASQTRPEVVQRVLRFVQKIGKLPLMVKDSPGFLVNRILLPYLIEATHFFESGARVEDIDEAMLDFGMPMGPLRLIDEVGVDVAADVAATLAASFSGRMRFSAALSKMIGAGLLGRKSGRGFYIHERGKKERVNDALGQFRQETAASALDRDELQKRMALLMVNEAARCVEEQIVSGPEDVDFGMVMGTGFAPFRGGPLRFADSRGVAKTVEDLSNLADVAASHFAPCVLLQEMARDGKNFYGN